MRVSTPFLPFEIILNHFVLPLTSVLCSALLSVSPGGIENRRQFSVPRFHGCHCEPEIIARRFLNQF